MNEGAVREAKLQRDCRLFRLLWVGMQRVQQLMCRVVAAEDGEGLRVVVRRFVDEGAAKQRALFDDGDAIAMTGEVVCGGETGRASAKNHDRLGARGFHVDRERNHTPAATASR